MGNNTNIEIGREANVRRSPQWRPLGGTLVLVCGGELIGRFRNLDPNRLGIQARIVKTATSAARRTTPLVGNALITSNIQRIMLGVGIERFAKHETTLLPAVDGVETFHEELENDAPRLGKVDVVELIAAIPNVITGSLDDPTSIRNFRCAAGNSHVANVGRLDA